MGSSVRMLFLNVGWFKFQCALEKKKKNMAQCVDMVQAGNTAFGGMSQLQPSGATAPVR